MSKRILVVEDQPDKARSSAICSLALITKSLNPRMASKRLQQWQKRDPISSSWVSNCPSWTATRSRGRSRDAIDSDHCRHLPRAERGRQDSKPAASIRK